MVVQALLNENISSLIPYSFVQVTGRMDGQTLNMIAEFQSRVLNKAKPDGKIDPGGQTERKLHEGIDSELTRDKLRAIMSNASDAQINTYLTPLLSAMRTNQINTPLRMAHFLAQLGHESGDFRYTEEIADGRAYEGRKDLGNTQAGDGPRFKGRGLIQLTGRTNYTNYGQARGRDFVTPPNNLLLATDANLAVDVSCWFWTTHGLNVRADADNLNGITRTINGGTNGLADRAAHLQRAKLLLVP